MKQKIFYIAEELTNGGPPRRTAGVASASEWPELKKNLRRNGFRIKRRYLMKNDETWVIHNRPNLHISRRSSATAGVN